jgi:hypothetical protein
VPLTLLGPPPAKRRRGVGAAGGACDGAGVAASTTDGAAAAVALMDAVATGRFTGASVLGAAAGVLQAQQAQSSKSRARRGMPQKC